MPSGVSHAVGEEQNYYSVCTGVTLSNPNALSCTATATGIEVRLAGAFKITTILPSYSADYNQQFGNVGIQFNGLLNSTPSGDVSGTLSKLVLTADKVMASTTIAGDFQVSGNSLTIAQGLSHSSVSGVMSSYVTEYRDGSYERLTGLSAPLSASQVIDSSMLANSALFTGNDTISLNLPARIYGDAWIMAGTGNDTVTIGGGGGQLHVDAGAGNDVISVLSGSHRIDGGSGVDVLKYSGAKSTYAIAKTAAGFNVSSLNGSQSIDMTGNIERVKFADGALAFDIAGNAGMAYRVYQAALNRTPDIGGLGYWMAVLDAGSSMRDVAGSFIGSAEFQGMYGANLSADAFISKLYANVLHRAPDQGGLEYWSNSVKNGLAYADMLVSFSESAENQLQVIGAIQNGISYTPFA